MEYTFKQIKLSPAEKLWLTELLKLNFSRFDKTSLRIKLWGKLPKDFEPDKIPYWLIYDNHLTLIGLWHVDPQNPMFKHIPKIIESIRNSILGGSAIKEVKANEVASLAGITEREAEIALRLLCDFQFFGGSSGSSDDYGCKIASFSLENYHTYEKFLNFENLEQEMEQYFIRCSSSSRGMGGMGGINKNITENMTQSKRDRDYHTKDKRTDEDRGFENDEYENVFRDNLITFLINEKTFPRESLNYDNLEEFPDFDLVVKHPDTKEFLAIFNFKCGYRVDDPEYLGCMANEYKKGFDGKHNPFVYIVLPSKESNEEFVIFEVGDDATSSEISYEDFPAYNQLLFASPLGAPGRRILNALIKLAKDKHDFNIHTPCQDYVDLQIKKNNRTAAQIHRLKDSDKNIALVLAGYQEDFGSDFISNFLSRGDIEILSGYSNKHPGEKNWLEGNLGHQDLKYKAGVYILKPGVLVLEDIEKEVGGLLELAKKNAENKGPAKPEEGPRRIASVDGNVATMADDRTSSKDLLGRKGLVQALANMFVYTKEMEGFTVALFGNWGEGKSTIMDLLKNQLRASNNDKFEFAKFNAWEYEHTDNIAAGLAQEVVDGLMKGIHGFRNRLWLHIVFAWCEYKWNFIYSILCLLIIGLSPLALYLLGKIWGNFGISFQAFLGVGILAILVPIIICIYRGLKQIIEHPLAAQLQTYLKLPAYGDHLGLVPVLKRHIKTLCSLCLGKGKKLIVFVDDLDRCHADCISKTLDAIRLVMTIPRVIVMLGIDHRIAFKAIEEHYQRVSSGEGKERQREGEIARDYLGKIIQLPIRLQEPTVQELEEFINKRLFPNVAKSSLQEKQKSQELMVQQSKSTDVEKETLKDFGETPAITNMPPVEYSTTKEVKAPGQKIIEIETEKEMLDTEDEYNEFSDLAQKFRFSNPRQLLRLRNSYRLIKALELQKARKKNQELGFDKLGDLMLMLFWQEFLHNRPKDLRRACKKALYEYIEISDEQTKVIINQVKGLILESFKDKTAYDETAKDVHIVVLPHSQED